MPKDSALSFVGQIMTAYKAIMKAEGGALEHAIECGKYLALAKENVEAAKPKRKWGAWLEEHCPDIHRNTAALYMRLADNESEIADCTSIREADMKLRQPKPGECGYESTEDSQTEKADDDAMGGDAQRVVQRKSSDDLSELLLSVDVDEVCAALIDAWDEDHIRQLCDRLHAHFTKPKDDLTIPLRHAPSAPMQPSQ
jgi:hypothetical protein